jgi:dihydrofolate reductase
VIAANFGAFVARLPYRLRMSFDVVVAADLDWGIGKSNGLPWPKLNGDMAHFRRITSACEEGKLNAIIMGRKTWISAEMNGKPLPKRLNVVITRTAAFAVPAGVIVATSLDFALKASNAPNVESIFVVGGAEIFREAFLHPDLRYIYLTRVDGHFGCDVIIPDPFGLGFVKGVWDGEQDGEDNEIKYRIERLQRGVPSGRTITR